MNLLRNVPKKYRNTILMVYISVIILFLGCLINYIYLIKYGTTNGTLGRPLTIGLMLIAAVLFFYFTTIKTHILKGQRINNKKTRKHLTIITTLFLIICIIIIY